MLVLQCRSTTPGSELGLQVAKVLNAKNLKDDNKKLNSISKSKEGLAIQCCEKHILWGFSTKLGGEGGNLLVEILAGSNHKSHLLESAL